GASAATTWPLRMDSGEVLAGGDVQVCRVRDGNMIQHFPATGWWTTFSPDGRLLRSGIGLWDVASGRRLGDFRTGKVLTDGGRRILLVEPGSTSGSPLPVATMPRSVRFAYVSILNGTKKDVGEFEFDPTHSMFPALEHPANFSPDGKYAVDRMMT